LKRVTLELGGKSPFIVFPDAELAQAIPAAAVACFALSGQNCMAGTRLFVADEVHDAFVEGLKQVATSLPVGDGMIPETLIGPLISGSKSTLKSRRRERPNRPLTCGGGEPMRSASTRANQHRQRRRGRSARRTASTRRRVSAA